MRANNTHRLSRGTAAVVAVSVQALVLYVLIVSLGLAPAPPVQFASPLTVELLPSTQVHSQPPALQPRLQTPRVDLGRSAPLIPVEIELPPSPLPESPQKPLPLAGAAASNARGGPPAQGALTDIDVLTRVKGDYPLEALLDRDEGTASLAVLVDEHGRPSRVQILHSSGHPELDRAAVQAVQRWTFAPATLNAVAVEKWGRVEVNFSLRDLEQDLLGSSLGKAAARTDMAELKRLLAVWKGGWFARLRSRAAEYDEAQQLQTPEIRQLLAQRGPVRELHFLGTAQRAPQTRSPGQSGRLRELGEQSILRWDVFQVIQSQGESHWYLAVAADGSIRDIEVDAS